jgi:hypothetical protein
MLRLIRHAFQPLVVRRRARVLVLVMSAAMLALGGAPAVSAASIDPGTLNPVPPDFYTCRATSDGAICRAHTVDPYSGEATGIWCGWGAEAVEILDNGIRDIEATRWYDGDGNLTFRIRTFLFRDAYLSNPATGRTLGYAQHNTDMDELAVPGDFSSSTVTGHGAVSITAPGFGSVLLNAGRTIVGPDGTIQAVSGPDRAHLDELCTALGTPNR